MAGLRRRANGPADGEPQAQRQSRRSASNGDQNELEDHDVPSEDAETVEAGAAAPAAAAAGWQPSVPGQLSHMQRERLDRLKSRVEELRVSEQSFKDKDDSASLLAVMRMKHEVEGDLVRTDAMSLPHLAVRISIAAPNMHRMGCVLLRLTVMVLLPFRFPAITLTSGTVLGHTWSSPSCRGFNLKSLTRCTHAGLTLPGAHQSAPQQGEYWLTRWHCGVCLEEHSIWRVRVHEPAGDRGAPICMIAWDSVRPLLQWSCP